MAFNFAREGINVLAGLAFGALAYVTALLITGVDVGLGTMTAAVGTSVDEVVFILVFAGSWIGDMGGKIWDARSTNDADPLNSA